MQGSQGKKLHEYEYSSCCAFVELGLDHDKKRWAVGGGQGTEMSLRLAEEVEVEVRSTEYIALHYKMHGEAGTGAFYS